LDADLSERTENHSEVERGLMRRLIETDLAAAWQPDRGSNTPIFFLDFRAFHVFHGEGFDCGLQIVAHQIRQGAKQFVVGVRLRERAVARMNSHFCWWSAENQPATSDIDIAETENVAEERAISFRIRAVEKDMKANDHGAKFSTGNNAA